MFANETGKLLCTIMIMVLTMTKHLINKKMKERNSLSFLFQI